MNRPLRLLTFAACFLPVMAEAQSGHAEVQQSHIAANVPAREVFDPLLRRDLLTFFKGSAAPSATHVEYELLRSAPTQSGVAYPKYYLWVKVLAGSTILEEGAVRVVAVERKQFEVTDFLTKSEVNAAPANVAKVFPTAVVPVVISHANAGDMAPNFSSSGRESACVVCV